MRSGRGGLERWLRAYRAALRLYPPSFRRCYGERMLEDVTDLLASERAAGRSLARPLARIAADVMRSAPREWQRVGSDVLRASRWARSIAQLGTRGVAFDAVASAGKALRRRPGFALGIIALLGVGIGAGATVFSVVSAYVLRAMPYPEPDRLVSVVGGAAVLPERAGDLFEIPVTWELDAFTLVGEAGPELVYGAWVSRGYLEVFGARAAVGRLFAAEEAGPGGASVAVISHDLWQRRYGGDPAVIGRRVRLFSSDRPEDAEVFTIVGVLARDSWHFNRYTEFLAPLRSDNPVYAGRLRRGVTRETAARVLEARSRETTQALPEDFRVEVVPLQERYTDSVRPMLRAATGAVLLLLLVACGNAAALLLVRAKARERELVIRRALGASNGRLGRELLAEGLLLSAGACVFGLVLATVALQWLGAAFEAHLGPSVPGGLDGLRVDARALAATLGVTVLAGVAFALV
ncbi:MAG: ABC transporter permease, partial [Longimicrobiales bacterium]